ncbi:MAG TPA: hypothetical protein VJU14_06290 [Solirubrobacterales bacterium]|nr:hypothetical protein [Solirubrobacterales bacterium]
MTDSSVEANVLLEFRMVSPVLVEVLDANAEDVIKAVSEHAADTALGPAIAVNEPERAIKLRFDVVAENDPAILQQVSTVIQGILQQADLKLIRSSIEATADGKSPSTTSWR